MSRTIQDSLAAAEREHDDTAQVLAIWSAALWTCRDDDVRPVIQRAVDAAVQEWIAADERLVELVGELVERGLA